MSPGQEVKVTYTTGAVSARKAIAGLAEKTGMKIACSPAMEKEILILRLQDAPMDQVMAQIASVTSGAWSKEGEISYLVVNGSARAIEANKAQQRLATQISESLKKQLAGFAEQAKEAKGAVPNPSGPFSFMGGGSEAMVKLASAIGAGQLASVPEDGRVVFSTNPTRMQRSLPGAAEPIIVEFVAEHNKQASASKQEEPAVEQSDPNMAAFMELFGNRMKKPQTISTAPAKAVVVASRKGMMFGYTLELKLYDANGKTLATESLPLATEMPSFMQAAIDGAKPPPEPPKNEGAEIALSPLSKELYGANLTAGGMSGAAHLKLSKELLDALRDPVDHDPLSFVYSEALIATATQRNEQLVAEVPDSVLSMFESMGRKSKLTSDTFLKELTGDEKAQIKESNGWLIVSPANPTKSRKQRTDRVALRTLIQVAQAQGYASLDNVAAYAAKNESPMDGAPASMTYIMLFAPSAMMEGMMGMVNWDLLRLYGMMDSSEKQNLRQGTRLAFGQLSPDQQAVVTKMLFGADEVLIVEKQVAANQKKQDPLTELMLSQMERFTGGNENDYRTEPTEVMPNGLPPDGYVVVDFSSEPVGQAQTVSTDFGRGTSLGPMELGLFKFFKEDPNMSQISSQMPTLDDLKVGTRSVYNFSFYVASLVSEKGQLNDDVFAKDAKVYKMTNLPADFQTKIDAMAASFKGNPIWKMMGQMGGMGQHAVPPQQ